MESLHKRIKTLRKKLNETQKTFGERFAVHFITVSQWEADPEQTRHRGPGPTARKMLEELFIEHHID